MAYACLNYGLRCKISRIRFEKIATRCSNDNHYHLIRVTACLDFYFS
jgi:hypothetical protein